jgi:hypothetical protein
MHRSLFHSGAKNVPDVSISQRFIRRVVERGFTPAQVRRKRNSNYKHKETAMKFLSLYKSAERGVPPTQEEMTKMGKMIEEGMKAGWLVATEGCLPSALGARVRKSDGKVTVTDGPFTESKEVVGGFAILRANSKEEAIQLVKDFLGAVGDGECELRQVYEAATDAAAGH